VGAGVRHRVSRRRSQAPADTSRRQPEGRPVGRPSVSVDALPEL